jgi:hypothetical protein
MRPLLAILAVVALLFSGRPAAAQNGDGLTLDVAAGFDGLSKQGEPLPVVVRAANSGPAFDGEVQVVVAGATDGEPVVYSAPLSLPTQSDKRVPLYVHLPSFGATIDVRLVEDGRTVASVQPDAVRPLGADSLLYGVVSADPGALTYLGVVPGTRSEAAVAFLDASDLPDIPAAWNALDVLVLDDVDTSRLSAGQTSALRGWVETGGTLVVTGGAGGPQTAAGVADLLPATVTGTDTVESLAALETFGGQALTSDGPFLLATTEPGPSAEVLLSEGGKPLLAAGRPGRGQAYFLALDPKTAPLAGWSGTRRVWELIAGRIPAPTPWSGGIRDSFAASSAVGSVPGLQLPDVWQLGLYGLVYALVIGPANYLVLKRMNRREWAWFTIPALVLLFSALTLLTSLGTRGSASLVNEMTVAQGPVGGSALRARTVLGLYSPRRGQFDLTLPLGAIPQPFGEGFGAIQSRNNLDAVVRAAAVVLRGVRAGSNEIATFLIDSAEPGPALSAAARLSPAGDEVTVEVRNIDTFALENATIVAGSEQRALGTLAPGDTATVVLPVVALPAPDPLLAPSGPAVDPLLNDPTLILGTTDYFNEAEAFARFQLLQSLYSGDSVTSRLPDPSDAVTLAGWRAGPALEATQGNSGDAAASGSTLYLLSIPVTRSAP